MEWERTTYFAVLFPHCSSDVCFLCFVVCFVHHVVLYFVCRRVRPAERRVLLGAGHSFFLGLCYPVFSFFLYENILHQHFSFPLVYLFFLFFSLFSCFQILSICQDGCSLSFRFFLFALFYLYLPLLFFSIVYLYINIDV